MAKFFSTLKDADLISDWATILDWLLDEDRFSTTKGWSKGVIGNFTKNVKKSLSLSSEKGNYACKALKDLTFPDALSPDDKATTIVMMGTGDSEGRNIIRHIRNGIAHGKVRCFNQQGEFWIEITDYGQAESGSKTSFRQTAYILISSANIFAIHKIYSDIEKSKRNDRSKKKPQQKKKAA